MSLWHFLDLIFGRITFYGLSCLKFRLCSSSLRNFYSDYHSLISFTSNYVPFVYKVQQILEGSNFSILDMWLVCLCVAVMLASN